MQKNTINKDMPCTVCGDYCDCGRYIGKSFSAEDYNKYLCIPGDKQKKIAKYLFEELKITERSEEISKRNEKREPDKKEKIEIFTAGVGPGRIEIPFLLKCLKKGISLKLTAVDLDTGMLREFYKNIDGVNEKLKSNYTIEEIAPLIETKDSFEGEKGIHYFNLKLIDPKSNEIEIEAFCGNLENLHKKKYYKINQYDYIFSIFVLHALTNWEEPLYHLLRMIKPKGRIVFAEEIGDVNWLDNHFDDIEKYELCTEDEIRRKILDRYYNDETRDLIKLHRRFWRAYHWARKEGLGKEWTKDTKASDLGVIEASFRRMEDLGLVKGCSFDNEDKSNGHREYANMLRRDKENTFRWRSRHPFTFNLLLQWIYGEKHLYTPLSHGLGSPKNKDDRENLKKEFVVEKWRESKSKHLCDFHDELFDKEDVGEQDALGVYMECWLKKEWENSGEKIIGKKLKFKEFKNIPIPRIEGHRFYMYTKKYKSNKKNSNDDNTTHKILYGNTVNLHRLKERIAHEIHHVPGHHKGEVPPRELTHRLFTLRDMYFRLFPFTHTMYTKWKLDDATDYRKGHWEEDMPILLTFPELHSKYKAKGCEDEILLDPFRQYLATHILYAWLTIDKGDKDFSFTNFVFRQMPEKFPISIIKVKDKKIKNPFIQFSQVSSGNVKKLDIYIPLAHVKRCIDSFNFKFGEEELNFETAIKRILSKGNELDFFIDRMKPFADKKTTLRQDFLLIHGNAFLCFAERLKKELSFYDDNIEKFKNHFKKKLEWEKKEIEKRFTGIEEYNDWPDKKPDKLDVEHFLYAAIHTAIIGYGVKELEWDIFDKYPGKCFGHDVKVEGKSYIREEGMGGLIVMRKRFDDEREDLFKEHHEAMLPIITGLWGRNDSILEINRLTKETMIKHGTKAAVAAIMGRNMSHNIGSHVLSNVTTSSKPDEKDLSRFHAYLQGRMDFIARIATEWPSWAMPMDFYLDVMRGFKEQRILLDNILRSEGLNRKGIEFNIEIFDKCVKETITLKENGTCGECQQSLGYNDIYNKFNCISKDDHFINTQYEKMWVNIPESSIGLQAFYSILENFIRNSAKHGDRNILSREGLKICVQLSEHENDSELYKIRIWDNVSTVTDDRIIKEMLEKLKGKLIKEDTGQVDEKNWGLKEMKISAAFLRRKDINQAEKDPSNFIKAVKIENGSDIFLGYEFYLEKPKIMLIVDERLEVDKDKKNEAKRHGIYFSQDVETEIKAGISHQFLFLKRTSKETIKKYIDDVDILPYRTFITKDSLEGANKRSRYQLIRESEFKYSELISGKQLSEENWYAFISQAYVLWLKKKSSITKYYIVIYLMEDKNNHVVKEWLEIAKRCNLSDNLFQLIILWKGDNQDKLNGVEKPIMFMRHNGIGLDWFKSSDVEGKCFYYESFDKGSPIFDTLWNAKNSIDTYLFLLKIIESALLKVLIIDERITENTFDKDKAEGLGWNTTKAYGLSLMGVETVTDVLLNPDTDNKYRLPLSEEVHNVIKSKKDFGSQMLRTICITKEDLQVYRYQASEDENKQDTEGLDMLVIHQGVLDKLNNEKNDYFLKTHWGNVEEFIKQLKKKIPFVIIDSGRGRPNGLPRNAKFIEYSILQDWILYRKSKFHIINALMSIVGEGGQDEQ